MVLCPDVAPYLGSRFDCCDLLQRSVIRYGAERKASSAIISTPRSGRNDRNGILPVYLAALPKIEAGDFNGCSNNCPPPRSSRGLDQR